MCRGVNRNLWVPHLSTKLKDHMEYSMYPTKAKVRLRRHSTGALCLPGSLKALSGIDAGRTPDAICVCAPFDTLTQSSCKLPHFSAIQSTPLTYLCSPHCQVSLLTCYWPGSLRAPGFPVRKITLHHWWLLFNQFLVWIYVQGH